jgi:hypothetical protein
MNLLVHCTKHIRWICRKHNERRNVGQHKNTLIKVTKMFDPHSECDRPPWCCSVGTVPRKSNSLYCLLQFPQLHRVSARRPGGDYCQFLISRDTVPITLQISITPKSKSQTRRCSSQIRLRTTLQITPSNCLTTPAEVHNTLTPVGIVHIGNTAELISKCFICWLRVM